MGRASEGERGHKSWWGWSRAKAWLESEFPDVWRLARDDSERKDLWQDYISDLRAREKRREDEMRQRNLGKLNGMLDDLDINLNSHWYDTRRHIQQSKDWAADEELQSVDPNELLNLYEDRIGALESKANAARQKERDEKRRRVRKNREDFVVLLEELKDQGHITSGTSWPAIFPHLKDDPRFHNMLGNPGSTPLELFYDIVDELDERVEELCRIIEGSFAQQKIDTTIDTTWEQFVALLERDGVSQRVRAVSEEGRKSAYKMVSIIILSYTLNVLIELYTDP